MIAIRVGLYGDRGNLLPEQALLDFALWREGLKQERRSLRLMITDLKWSFPTKDSLQLQFFLPAGSYATTVLREFVSI